MTKSGGMNEDDYEVSRPLRAGLRNLEARSPVPDDARTRVREVVLAAYDSAGPEVRDRSIEVINFEELDDSARRDNVAGQRSRLTWLVAAAIVLVALGSLAWVGVRNDPAVTRIADVNELDDGPLLLPGGEFRTDVLGTSLSFETDRELWLVEERAEGVLLSEDPDNPMASTIVFFRPTSLVAELEATTIGELLDGTDPRFGAQFQPAVIGGIESRSWRFRLSSESSLIDGCEQFAPCFRPYEGLDVALIRSGYNDLFEVPQAEEDPLMVLSLVAVPTGFAFGEPFEELMASLEFGSPEPNPLD